VPQTPTVLRCLRDKLKRSDTADWRRGRDSNPRSPGKEDNGFRDRPVRPLRHLSAFIVSNT
jgi:hypothetical protein